MVAFQENDANRFFGRSQEVARAVTRLRDQPMLVIAGPSGVGKSSFVRAGVVPTLKLSGESWETLIVRPGRNPVSELASLVENVLGERAPSHAVLLEKLSVEPGFLGVVLRSRARKKRCKIMLFVDQFEELYTLVSDPREREIYVGCLSGVADDAAAPLRVCLSMRSDFLDRAVEDRRFMDDLTRSLFFLPPPDRNGLREALVQPAEMAGYQFESKAMIDAMLAPLETTPGALPLLQFAASRLWDKRDRRNQQLTQVAFDEMGGIAGSLATHADQVLEGLSNQARDLARAVFERLVTPERTRAIVDVAELRGLSSDPAEIDSLLDSLVQSRLLLVQSGGEGSEGAAVEIVHESMIGSWPTLARWLEEGQEHAAYLAQLRFTSGQWDARGRPGGLLWRGEALDEAKRFVSKLGGELAARERSYLDAVFALGNRAARIRRFLVIGTIGFLGALVAGSAVALVTIRESQTAAVVEAEKAGKARALALSEKAAADVERDKARKALDELQEEERQKLAAEHQAKKAGDDLDKAHVSLAEKNAELSKRVVEAKAAEQEARRQKSVAVNALKAAKRAKKSAEVARNKAEKLYKREQARRKKLEQQGKKVIRTLN